MNRSLKCYSTVEAVMNDFNNEKPGGFLVGGNLFEVEDDLEIDEVAIAEKALAMDEMFDSNKNSGTLFETRALDQMYKSL